MLPASNRGVGMNICFPDVCNTIVGPATVPIPYPNIAMNVQAAPFSPTVKVSMMPALNLGSMIPMTMGDEAGTAHPTIKGMGKYTMGNPIVFVDGMPAINLTCPTTGNNMNAPLGAVLVPSAVNVFYCDAAPAAATGDELEVEVVERGAVARVALRSLGPAAPSRLHRAIADLVASGARALIIDLRGNPGGELDAAVRIAEDFLDAGDEIARIVDAEGDEQVLVARHPRTWDLALELMVDGGTASAAEVLAGALQAHRRALVTGEPTFGKGSALALTGDAAGRRFGACAGTVLLPSGIALAGRGIVPTESAVAR